ncbi:MAG: urease accessory protein UreF [Kineosporiaceae bacterium]
MPVPASSVLLLLADQRLPSGAHGHSGGIEQAVAEGLVRDAPSLEWFLAHRVRTAGLVAAGLAAAATTATAASIARLDAEADARTASPAVRGASRAQGRGLLRTARALWAAPSPSLAWSDLGARPHHAVVVGCAAGAAGLGAAGAALLAAHLAVSEPATAAQRLLALDPLAVAAVTATLAAVVDAVAADAAATGPPDSGADPWAALPDATDPRLDALAELHAARSDRLFAS